jgi:flavin reductase (DIM6/NTAB) family NADH-FMN oxidoreductase RutF
MQDLKKFRQCLSKFATGVTVVTCSNAAGNCFGITANSFSSVSLEPPLILWSIAKVSNSLQAFLDAEYFAINILASGQKSVSGLFAQSKHDIFDGVEYSLSEREVPILEGTLACFECRTNDVFDCGDHHIVIGEVIDYRSTDVEPLLFFDGDYQVLG